MKLKQGWLVAVVIVVLLVAACGPGMATPTPVTKTADGETPTASMAPVKKTPTDAPTQEAKPTQATDKVPTKPVSSGELPVDADDWHVLGAPDAPVTIVEYSDFQ